MNIFRGSVVSIDDSTFSGIIKCRILGLYNTESIGSIDDEDLPNVYPLHSPNLNSFSTPKVDEEVYVILDRGNKYTPFWFAKSKLSDLLLDKLAGDYEGFKSITIDEDEDLEIYYSRGEGIIIKQAQAVIKLFKDEIKLETPDRKLHIKDGQISIGSLDKAAEPATLGDKNVNALTDLATEIGNLATALNVYTTSQTAIVGSVTYLAPLGAALSTLNAQALKVKGTIASVKGTTIPATKSTLTSLD